MKKKLLTFIITLALWFVFAGRVNIEVFLLGSIICSIISLMLADNVHRSVQMRYAAKEIFLKIYYIFMVISAYIYDVFLSAVRVSRHAFEIRPSFSPRIVSIKTPLKDSNNIAILAYFITFTQGSLAMDFDHINKQYFIHWIDIHSEDEEETKKARIRKHHNLIAKIVN